jgi:asparagine synthase (glutamine-hydrolysing)
MSAICGIASRNGDLVSPEDLNAMMQSVAHHGPDGLRLWYDRLVGLGQQTHHIAPESFDEVLPCRPAESALTIAASARIDNRAELIRQLRLDQPEVGSCSDRILILAAYEKWGERCPEFLLGDFAFAIWDERERKLFCCRDHMGVRPFFYYADHRRFIFASEPKAILAAGGIETKVNKSKLATLAFPEIKSLFWDQSWFEEIFPLPAGTSLTVDARGIRRNKYWTPQFGTELPYKSDKEILEAFKALMFEVVSARLPGRSPVTALLSGGLDSSSIVSVAARVLQRQNRELHTLSAVLPAASDAGLTDERNFIDQFRDWPNVRVNYVNAGARGPFDNLEELAWGYDSPLITSRHYLYTAFAEAAGTFGARSILDGISGELGPSFEGDDCYAEMLFQFRWRTLLHELKLRKSSDGKSAWRVFDSTVLRPLAAATPLRRLMRRSNSEEAARRRRPIRKEFVETLLAGISPNLQTDMYSRAGVLLGHKHTQLQRQLEVHNKAPGLNGFVGYGQVEMSYPFKDKRLLQFCLAVPSNLKLRDGYRRYLVRAGLDQVLPQQIQWRTTKGPFSPDYFRRYNSQRKQVQSILADIRPNDPVRAVVDIPRLQQLAALPVADNEVDTFGALAALDLVPVAVYLIYFLRRFPDFQH